MPDSPESRKNAARWTHYYWAQSEELLADIEAFPDGRDFWANYTRRALEALDCPPECVEDLYEDMMTFMQDEFQPEAWTPPEVIEVLEVLEKAGYRMAVLSNRREPCHEDLASLGILDFFDFALVAGEIEIWKPDPRIFEPALERLNARPEEVIYVGDNYYADVLGAQAAGLHAVLLDPDGLFPEADCPRIDCINEVLHLLPTSRNGRGDSSSRS